MEQHLVVLNPDHPGFRDATYRARRDRIAAIATAHRAGEPVPEAPYSEQEHQVWRQVLAALEPGHQAGVHSALLDAQAALGLSQERIPQLEQVNEQLAAAAGFRMEPVAGLVTPRAFLEHLGRRVFLSTQYIRHHSRPLYTPEPDVIHELVGHAASLLHPGLCALNQAFGRVAAASGPEGIEAITRVYWYTLEFGLVRERGEIKAWGAGLLSSVGELERSLSGHVPLLEWDIQAITGLAYDPTAYQPAYVVAPSLEQAIDELQDWLSSF